MKQKFIALAVMAAAAPALQAADISVSGYGTLGMTRLSTDNAMFRNTTYAPNGARQDWTGKVDSRAGLQITGTVDPQISGTLHLLSRQNVDNGYTPTVEWAYGKYQIAPALTLRAGRLALPAFAYSDYINVGYAQPFLRAPVEVYGQLPIASFDGADAVWKTQAGGFGLTVQPFAGHSRIEARFSDTAGTRADGEADLFGMNVVAQKGDWSFRVGRIEADVSIESAMTTQMIAMIANPQIANQMRYQDKRSSFSGVGAMYDNGNVLVQGEYTQRDAAGFLADTTGWYVLGGYRFGSVMPYAIVARQKVTSATASTDPVADGLLKFGNTSQKSWSLGARWDLAANLAAKAQYSRITPDDGSKAGLLMYSGSTALERQSVMSVALDAVF